MLVKNSLTFGDVVDYFSNILHLLKHTLKKYNISAKVSRYTIIGKKYVQ